jgi:hypothetical protein
MKFMINKSNYFKGSNSNFYRNVGRPSQTRHITARYKNIGHKKRYNKINLINTDSYLIRPSSLFVVTGFFVLIILKNPDVLVLSDKYILSNFNISISALLECLVQVIKESLFEVTAKEIIKSLYSYVCDFLFGSPPPFTPDPGPGPQDLIDLDEEIERQEQLSKVTEIEETPSSKERTMSQKILAGVVTFTIVFCSVISVTAVTAVTKSLLVY